jgi:hypothetical protein
MRSYYPVPPNMSISIMTLKLLYSLNCHIHRGVHFNRGYLWTFSKSNQRYSNKLFKQIFCILRHLYTLLGYLYNNKGKLK